MNKFKLSALAMAVSLSAGSVTAAENLMNTSDFETGHADSWLSNVAGGVEKSQGTIEFDPIDVTNKVYKIENIAGGDRAGHSDTMRPDVSGIEGDVTYRVQGRIKCEGADKIGIFPLYSIINVDGVSKNAEVQHTRQFDVDGGYYVNADPIEDDGWFIVDFTFNISDHIKKNQDTHAANTHLDPAVAAD